MGSRRVPSDDASDEFDVPFAPLIILPIQIRPDIPDSGERRLCQAVLEQAVQDYAMMPRKRSELERWFIGGARPAHRFSFEQIADALGFSTSAWRRDFNAWRAGLLAQEHRWIHEGNRFVRNGKC